MSVNVINLRRRADRREAMLAECERVGVDAVFVDAVDGQDLEVPDFWRNTAGAYACYLSHLRLLEQSVDAGVPGDIIVVEDDVLLDADFTPVLDRILAAPVRPFDLLYLGGRHLRPPLADSGLRRATALMNNWGYVVPAERVENHYYDLLNVTRGLDIYLLERQPHRRFYLPPFDLVRPNPVFAGDSDTATGLVTA
jgi:GR25 family glycosyltransferase involved in LPS biosynthesis